MNQSEVIGWVLCTVAGCLRLSQAKMLAVFVAAAKTASRRSSFSGQVPPMVLGADRRRVSKWAGKRLFAQKAGRR